MGGDTEDEGRAGVDRRGERRRGERPEMAHRTAAAQRAEHAEHQPVHVEQRQGVGEHVRVRPGPGIGERVEARRDRPAGQHRTLRRPGGPGGVDDQRRSGARQVGIDVSQCRTSGAVRLTGDRDPADLGQRGGKVDGGVGEHGAGRRIRDDVRQLARTAARVDRHRRHPGEQRRDDPDGGGQRRRRPHRDAVQPGDLAGEGTGAGRQLGVGERTVGKGQRGPACGRVEKGGQQRVHGQAPSLVPGTGGDPSTAKAVRVTPPPYRG